MLNKYKFNTAKSYRKLGLALGLSPIVLDQIEADHKAATRCLQEVLSAWLHQITKPLTWSVLEDALNEIGEKYAAEGIHRRESHYK